MSFDLLFNLNLVMDFLSLSKKDFVNKYNCTNIDYDNMMLDFNVNKIEYLADLMREAENQYIEDIKW